MRKSRIGLTLGVTCSACALLLAALPVAAKNAPTDATARAAIQYLREQQSRADGSIPSSPGSYAPTELYIIAAAADGQDVASLRNGKGPSALTYLQQHVAEACGTAGKCGELIQAVVAARADPHSFAGRDLVAGVQGEYDARTGAYGDGQAFTQALAVQGLVAAGAPVPAAALHFIESAQDRDGGWDYLDRANDANPKDQATSDTNSTAMSLMALDAAGDHSRDAVAIDWLRTQQDSDGGFPYQKGAGSDPDSTALVVQASVAVNGDGDGASASGGPYPLQYLARTQTTGGGYIFPGSTKPDAFTTSQVPLALLLRALPFVPPPPQQVHAGTVTPVQQPGGSFPLPLVVVLVIVVVLIGSGVVLARRR